MAIILQGRTDQPSIIYAQYAANAAVTATDSAAGLYPSDILIATEDTIWAPANQTGSKEVVIDHGAAIAFSAMALLGRNMAGVNLEVRASSDNFATDDVLVMPSSAIQAPVNAAWFKFDGSFSKRYIKLIFSGFSNVFSLAHVVAAYMTYYPYFESDPDPENSKPIGNHQVGAAGLYVGSNQIRTMRELTLDWGNVTDYEFASIQAWKAACIDAINPFFMIPDSAQSDCYFGWVEDPSFSAPLVNGLRRIKSIKMTTRGV